MILEQSCPNPSIWLSSSTIWWINVLTWKCKSIRLVNSNHWWIRVQTQIPVLEKKKTNEHVFDFVHHAARNVSFLLNYQKKKKNLPLRRKRLFCVTEGNGPSTFYATVSIEHFSVTQELQRARNTNSETVLDCVTQPNRFEHGFVPPLGIP